MSDQKGHIFLDEEEFRQPYYTTTGVGKIIPDPTGGRNFCPSCGSGDITFRKQICFGNPGYLMNATCRSCGNKF